MIAAHGARRIGDAHPLNGPWIIGRQGLSLDHRNPFHTEGLSRQGGPVPQDASERGSLAHFLDEFDGRLGIAEPRQPGLHGHADRRSHFNRIQTVIVVHAVQHGNRIKIIDAAIRPMGPDSFIFRLLCQELTILVQVCAGTTDRAPPMAAMGRQTAPGDLQLSLRFSADFGNPGETPPQEVVGGITPRFIDHICQDIGSISGKPFSGHRVLFQTFNEGLVGRLEFLGILRSARHGRGRVAARKALGAVKDEPAGRGLVDVLGAVHGAHATASRIATWFIFRIIH